MSTSVFMFPFKIFVLCHAVTCWAVGREMSLTYGRQFQAAGRMILIEQ